MNIESDLIERCRGVYREGVFGGDSELATDV